MRKEVLVTDKSTPWFQDNKICSDIESVWGQLELCVLQNTLETMLWISTERKQ